MISITLADVIRRGVLGPRDAASLTLAVATEWDRLRARLGPVVLPSADAIRLHRNGEISFEYAHSHGVPDGDSIGGLSELLDQLLDIAEYPASRPRVFAGSLLTIEKSIEDPDLLVATEERFRAALASFADNDPKVLAAVFVRATACPAPPAHHLPRKGERRGPERRRSSAAVTELRRSVRELEQQAFETRRRSRDEVWRVDRPITRSKAVWGATAACAVGLLAFAGTSVHFQPPVSNTAASQLRPASGRSASDIHLAAVPEPARTEPPPAARARPVAASARAQRPNTVTKRSGKTQRARAVAMFPGGTRAFTWATHAR